MNIKLVTANFLDIVFADGVAELYSAIPGDKEHRYRRVNNHVGETRQRGPAVVRVKIEVEPE